MIFNEGADIFHTQGSRVVWSTTRRPVVLLPNNKVTLNSFDIAWPHPATSDAYGYSATTSGGFTAYAAASFVTIVPQEWDSGLTAVATLPAGCNYFQVDVNLARINSLSSYLGYGEPPVLLPSEQWHTLDGASAVAERFSLLVRIFRFERIGNTVYLRRKQSVANVGARFPWLSGNNPTNGAGGQRNGWTYGSGGINGHPVSMRAQAFNAFSNRGQSGMAATDDNTNYASTWRGTVIITPGYIKA